MPFSFGLNLQTEPEVTWIPELGLQMVWGVLWQWVLAIHETAGIVMEEAGREIIFPS